jgi:hypothetical protein
MWDLRQPIPEKIHCNSAAHEGWVWTIASHGDSVFTGSWDRKLKEWQLEPAGLRQVSEVKCEDAVLCTVAEDNLLIAGTNSHKICLKDRREHGGVVESFKVIDLLPPPYPSSKPARVAATVPSNASFPIEGSQRSGSGHRCERELHLHMRRRPVSDLFRPEATENT